MTSLLTRLRERFFRITKPGSAFAAGSPMPSLDENTAALLNASVQLVHAWQLLGNRCAVVVQLGGIERVITPQGDLPQTAGMLYAAADAVADETLPKVKTKQ